MFNAAARQFTLEVIARNRGKEHLVVLDEHWLPVLLGSIQFRTQVAIEDAEVTISVEDVEVLGFGSTLDEALADALNELHTYALEFFAHPQRYRGTYRERHAPWLLRFLITPENERRSLLTTPPTREESPAA
ncbi:MAG: hypothetical protein KGJ86_10960 [Chloroflexota bacterium]|nr:hypothetical protein [Chloroflexota bacterium]